ncbi:MAG: rhomboid family intramembrane serine protease [Acidiferrobacterales bacterium]|nr:rhomboid family intramembrane serine protease [Acidiferrobacterales bacterium]
MPPISELLKSNVNRLIAINLVVYFLLEAIFADQRSGFELFFWKSDEFNFWQPFSYMFLHGNVMPHLLFNMFALWSFGRLLEQVWGNQRFLIFYLACGVGAALVHEVVTQIQFQALYDQLLAGGLSVMQVENILITGRDVSAAYPAISQEMLREFYYSYHTPTVGASGAVYGILMAFAMLFPNFKIMLIFLPVPVAAKYFVPVLLLIDLTAGITGFSIFGGNIAHFAHIGGAVAGFLLVQYWMRKRA